MFDDFPGANIERPILEIFLTYCSPKATREGVLRRDHPNLLTLKPRSFNVD